MTKVKPVSSASAGKHTWLTMQQAAHLVGRQRSAITAWLKQGLLEWRQDGRKKLVTEASVREAAAAKDASKHGRRPKSRGNYRDDMTAAEFARRAGVSDRHVQRLMAAGKIPGYTEAALQELQEKRRAGQVIAVDAQTSDEESMAQASKAEIDRALQFQKWRAAKLEADKREGLVYDAETVQAVVRRLAQLWRSGWQQAALVLAPRLEGLDAADMRGEVTRYGQQQIEAARALAAELAAELEEGGDDAETGE